MPGLPRFPTSLCATLQDPPSPSVAQRVEVEVVRAAIKDVMVSGEIKPALADAVKARAAGRARLKRARSESAALRSLANASRIVRENGGLYEPRLARTNNVNHLGTLGTGNHFIELCLDESDRVWIMLHSGSRGVGNAIGTRNIERAKELTGARLGTLPDGNLAWLAEGSPDFKAYVEAVGWAQDFPRWNRRVMMDAVIDETPMAYKPIDAVMAAQSDLLEIVHIPRQAVCVRG